MRDISLDKYHFWALALVVASLVPTGGGVYLRQMSNGNIKVKYYDGDEVSEEYMDFNENSSDFAVDFVEFARGAQTLAEGRKRLALWLVQLAPEAAEAVKQGSDKAPGTTLAQRGAGQAREGSTAKGG